MSPDVRQLVGDWAENVDNRGLLYEKFALPKSWGIGDDQKLNDAGRWSVLRIVTRGSELLRRDAERLRREADGRNVQPNVRQRKQRDAEIADKMSKVGRFDPELVKAANSGASRFLTDLDKSYAGRVATFEATLGARLMVNLAGGVVENAGIALDRCFGLPFIPGSAVKGIARHQALWEIHEAQPGDKRPLLRLAMLLFGYGAKDIMDKGDFAWAGGAANARETAKEIGANDFKGCACFLPAYPTTPPTLVVDMVNPHYPEYYRGKRSRADDNENPVPNYFPAVEKGSTFGFAVLLNRVPPVAGITAAELLDQARDWLKRAVTKRGVGAKTAAGYGWFELGRKTSRPVAASEPVATGAASVSRPEAPPASPAEILIAKWRGKLTATGNFPAALPEIAALQSDADLKRVFEAVIPQNERERLRKNNPYWQSFTSGRHGEAGRKILQRLGITLN
jgi:CRISPR type III-B/RAMP module RAMP protein Cmr6